MRQDDWTTTPPSEPGLYVRAFWNREMRGWEHRAVRLYDTVRAKSPDWAQIRWLKIPEPPPVEEESC